MVIAAAINVDPDAILDVDTVMVGEDASGDVIPTASQLIRVGTVTVN